MDGILEILYEVERNVSETCAKGLLLGVQLQECTYESEMMRYCLEEASARRHVLFLGKATKKWEFKCYQESRLAKQVANECHISKLMKTLSDLMLDREFKSRCVSEMANRIQAVDPKFFEAEWQLCQDKVETFRDRFLPSEAECEEMAMRRTCSRTEPVINEPVADSTEDKPKRTHEIVFPSRKRFLRKLGVELDEVPDQHENPIMIDDFGKLYQFKLFLLKKSKKNKFFKKVPRNQREVFQEKVAVFYNACCALLTKNGELLNKPLQLTEEKILELFRGQECPQEILKQMSKLLKKFIVKYPLIEAQLQKKHFWKSDRKKQLFHKVNFLKEKLRLGKTFADILESRLKSQNEKLLEIQEKHLDVEDEIFTLRSEILELKAKLVEEKQHDAQASENQEAEIQRLEGQIHQCHFNLRIEEMLLENLKEILSTKERDFETDDGNENGDGSGDVKGPDSNPCQESTSVVETEV